MQTALNNLGNTGAEVKEDDAAAVHFPSGMPMEVCDDGHNVVYGEVPDTILDHPLELAFSNRGAKTQPGKWGNVKLTVRDFLNNVVGEHTEGAKDGKCFLQGSVINGDRKAQAVPGLDLLVLDLDSGDSIDAVRAKIMQRGLFGIIYTTFSHLKPITDVKKDAVIAFCKNGDPSAQDVANYLREEKRYQPWVLDGCSIEKTEHTEKGVMIFLKHKPMPKFRVVLLLKDRFVIAERHGSQRDAVAEWRERYAGASRALETFFDRACTDPSRLFYTPRHPKDATEWRIEVIAGAPLDIDQVDRVTAEELREEALDPMARVAKEMGVTAGGEYKTPGLKGFAKEHGSTFEIADFFDEYAPEDNRGPMTAGSGRVFKCPFEEDRHTPLAPGLTDMGFFVINALDSDRESFVAKCSHDSCASTDRLGFLDKFICDNSLDLDACKKHCVKVIAEIEEEDKVVGDETAAPAPTENGGLPKGFENINGFLCFVTTNENKKPVFTRIARAIHVLAAIKDQDSMGRGFLIRYTDAQTGKAREMDVPMIEALGDGMPLFKRFVDGGLWFDPVKENKTKLLTCIGRMDSRNVVTVVKRPGWHGGTWLSPLGEAIGPASNLLRLAKGAGAADKEKRGRLEEWQKAAVVACQEIENPHWLLSICAGFAGCVADLAQLPTMGISLSGATTTGKTTCQILQASAVGNPKQGKGVLHSCLATANQCENLAVIGSGSTVCFDEVANLKSPLSALLFMLSGGVGKARGNERNELRPVASWNTFFTLSNELPIRAVVEHDRETLREGVGVRALDLDMSGAKKVAPETMAAINAVGVNYGWALPAFVRHLFALNDGAYAKDPALVASEVERLAGKLAGPAALAKARRAAHVLALLQWCGEVAQDAGLIPPAADGVDVGAAVGGVWAAYLEDAGASLAKAEGDAVEGLRRYFAANWGLTVLPVTPDKEDPDVSDGIGEAFEARPYREAVARHDEKYIYVLGDILPKIANVAMPCKALAQRLHTAGCLIRDGKNLSHRFVPGGVGLVKHYRLPVEAFRPKAGAVQEAPTPEQADAETVALEAARKARDGEEIDAATLEAGRILRKRRETDAEPVHVAEVENVQAKAHGPGPSPRQRARGQA